MVAFCNYLAAGDGEGVVILGAAHLGGGKTGPELDALDRRDGEHGLGDVPFQGIEDWLTEAGGQV